MRFLLISCRGGTPLSLTVSEESHISDLVAHAGFCLFRYFVALSKQSFTYAGQEP